jgi:hypothetical protein
MFGNDCLGTHDLDEFAVDINGNSVEMYDYIDTITVFIIICTQRFKPRTLAQAGWQAG